MTVVGPRGLEDLDGELSAVVIIRVREDERGQRRNRTARNAPIRCPAHDPRRVDAAHMAHAPGEIALAGVACACDAFRECAVTLLLRRSWSRAQSTARRSQA